MKLYTMTLFDQAETTLRVLQMKSRLATMLVNMGVLNRTICEAMLVILLVFSTVCTMSTNSASIFEVLKSIIVKNDTSELDEDGLSRIQQIRGLPLTNENKTDEEEEKQWLSDKGQFVMRMPPWTKSNSSAQVMNRSRDAQVASSDLDSLDYDLEESFERVVTPPTSPDPWATGTIRSPRTGEDDDLDIAPTNPMKPERPQITAAVDTFFFGTTKNPFPWKFSKSTTKWPPTKNFIKFTKSAIGNKWGRVTTRLAWNNRERRTSAGWDYDRADNGRPRLPSTTNPNLDGNDYGEGVGGEPSQNGNSDFLYTTTGTSVRWWRQKDYTRRFRSYAKNIMNINLNSADLLLQNK